MKSLISVLVVLAVYYAYKEIRDYRISIQQSRIVSQALAAIMGGN